MRSLLKFIFITCCSASIAGEVHLQWMDNSDNEDGFIILRDTIGDGKDDIEISTVPSNNGTGKVKFTDYHAIDGSVYIYQIIAFNDSGRSGPSNRLTVVVDRGNTPIAATELTEIREGI